MGMNSQSSVWLDVGCGAPTIALQGSCFNKATYALDLPPTINIINEILNEASSLAKNLMKRIALIGVDVLKINMENLPADIIHVTHVTILIGIPKGEVISLYL